LLDQNALLVKEKASRTQSHPTDSKKKGKETQNKPQQPTPEEVYGISVNQYLFLFLKFISTVIPTIEYDNTASI